MSVTATRVFSVDSLRIVNYLPLFRWLAADCKVKFTSKVDKNPETSSVQSVQVGTASLASGPRWYVLFELGGTRYAPGGETDFHMSPCCAAESAATGCDQCWAGTAPG